MENSGPVILDISSDEEGGGKGDESCDLVLVGGAFQNPSKKSRREPLKLSGNFVGGGGGGGGGDDDCVVLEGDPDKPVVAEPTQKSIGVKVDGECDDGDDVEIVAEKGEVACRDFPHARHLCAKYLFASTGHQIHCSLCHCYVCDSVAPCLLWGTGLSSSDHCHATDKEEYWKAERERTKKGPNPAPAVAPLISNTTSLARPLLAQLGPLPHYPIGLPPVAPVYMPQPTPVSKNPISNPAAAVTPLINNTTLARPLLAQTLGPLRHYPIGHPPVAPFYMQQPAGPRPTPISKNPISKLHSVRPLGSQLSKNGPMAEIKKMLKERRRSSAPRPVNRTARRRSTLGTRSSHSQQPVNVGHASYLPSQNPTSLVSGIAQPSQLLRPCTKSSVFTAYLNEMSSRFGIPPNQSAGNNNSGNQFSQPQAQVGVPVDFQQVSQEALNRINSSLKDLNSKVSQLQSAGSTVSQTLNRINSGLNDLNSPVSQLQSAGSTVDSNKGPVADNFQQGSFGSALVVAALERVPTRARSSSRRPFSGLRSMMAAPTPKSIGVKVDDVVIVAEKGEVACRDFPHARHLCAKYRFASTRHEIHCSLCYCYVCDSVAPCLLWGTGLSSSDHCHATDKDDYWRAKRKRTKKGSNPVPAVGPLISNTSLARPLLAQTPAPRHHQVRTPVAPVYRPQPVLPQPTTVSKNPISKLHNVRPLGSQLSKNGPVSEIKKMPKESCRSSATHTVHRTAHQRSTWTHSSNSSAYAAYGNETSKRFVIPPNQSVGNNSGNQSSQPQAQVRTPVAPVYRPQPVLPQPTTVSKNPISKLHNVRPLGSKLSKNGPVSEIKKMPKESCRSSATHTVHRTAHQRSTGTCSSNSSAYTAYGNETSKRFVIPPNQSVGNNLGNQFSQPQAQVYSNKHQGAGAKESSQIKGPVVNFKQGSSGSARVVAPLKRVHTTARSSSKHR
ncbi:RPM1 interacting protein 13 [Striga hermonthica]|uniref:RPM1 interacting protein 13 n=1 Tax=Striga hermonthica TaxID=68872 RepID=A0A9N7NQE1_STRHE|nr:RPM1 interacting protein 13 [Striga hermonthica]